MAEAYIGLGEYDDAESKLNEGLKIDPKNNEILKKIQEINQLREQDKEKEKRFQEALAAKMKKVSVI